MARYPISGALAALAISACAAQAQQVAETTLLRADGAEVPVKVSGPPGGCPRTAIISHGLGGRSGGSAQLARTLASSGWRVIAMDHVESGPPVLRAAFLSGRPRLAASEAASDPARHRARFADLDAAWVEATRNCRPPQVLLIGHSMGATTTMLEAGNVSRFGRFGRNRFDAYVALSPQGIGYLWEAGAWNAVSKPVLMITGTRDSGFDGDWRTRLAAFEGLPVGKKRLAIIPDITHGQLSGFRDPFASTIAALINEFARDLEQGALRPSRVSGAEVRDK